jgi:hypothetical protein
MNTHKQLAGATLLRIAVALAPSCASLPPSDNEAVDATVPSYDTLFATYFDKGTPGHCATAGCHADPHHNVWLCEDKDSCYQGMLDVGLIDADDPTHSQIADDKHSPLSWVNPSGGNMPLDAQGENPAGRAAIKAWIAAGAAPPQ